MVVESGRVRLVGELNAIFNKYELDESTGKNKRNREKVVKEGQLRTSSRIPNWAQDLQGEVLLKRTFISVK
jgi:hypothetical protein